MKTFTVTWQFLKHIIWNCYSEEVADWSSISVISLASWLHCVCIVIVFIVIARILQRDNTRGTESPQNQDWSMSVSLGTVKWCWVTVSDVWRNVGEKHKIQFSFTLSFDCALTRSKYRLIIGAGKVRIEDFPQKLVKILIHNLIREDTLEEVDDKKRNRIFTRTSPTIV